MSGFEVTVSLQVRHPSMCPDEISEALNLKPQHAWKAGDPRRVDDGDSRGLYRETFWTAPILQELGSTSETIALESALTKATVQLRRSQRFLSKVRSDGGETALSVGVFGHESFRLELSADLLALVGKLGMAISLDADFRPPSGEEADVDEESSSS